MSDNSLANWESSDNSLANGESSDNSLANGESSDNSSANGDPFLAHRSLLFTVAYEMLGSAADAEDVVQETWLRWAAVDQSEVRDPRAYLVQTITRQSLNRMRTLTRRREDYVGEWLPEPLITTPDLAEDVVFAESVSIAMLTVLETLGPVERAVFVLRDVFDSPYEEIARVLEKSPAAVRQIAHRAREHVAARRPRMRVSRSEQHTAVEVFRSAVETGNLEALVEVLAPDVVMVADGGGIAQAFPRPISGSDNVARVLSRYPGATAGAPIEVVLINGSPALRVDPDGEFDTTVSIVVDDGRVTHIYAVRNPAKLARLGAPTELSRS